MTIYARWPKRDTTAPAWLNLRTGGTQYTGPPLFDVATCPDCAGQMMVVDPEWLQCPLCHSWQPINNPAVSLAISATQLSFEA